MANTVSTPSISWSLAKNIWNCEAKSTSVPLYKGERLWVSSTSALKREIDNLACKLYDLTPEEIVIVEEKG